LFEETPAKRRRAAAGTFVAPSTTPLPRKRFDPTLQSTGASQMSAFIFKYSFIK
jgi:hypothetical protein